MAIVLPFLSSCLLTVFLLLFYCFDCLVWALFYYFITGLGITAGYHRLFAHRAYEANWITRVFMLFAGSGALEGSVKWWCGQ